jgi:hypothetical protein
MELKIRMFGFADHESSLRAKLLDAFTARWFRATEPEGANKAALELCAVARNLIAEAGGAAVPLPLPHDTPLARLLNGVLLGSEGKQATGKARSKRQSVAAAAEARLVRYFHSVRYNKEPSLALGRVDSGTPQPASMHNTCIALWLSQMLPVREDKQLRVTAGSKRQSVSTDLEPLRFLKVHRDLSGLCIGMQIECRVTLHDWLSFISGLQGASLLADALLDLIVDDSQENGPGPSDPASGGLAADRCTPAVVLLVCLSYMLSASHECSVKSGTFSMVAPRFDRFMSCHLCHHSSVGFDRFMSCHLYHHSSMRRYICTYCVIACKQLHEEGNRSRFGDIFSCCTLLPTAPAAS